MVVYCLLTRAEAFSNARTNTDIEHSVLCLVLQCCNFDLISHFCFSFFVFAYSFVLVLLQWFAEHKYVPAYGVAFCSFCPDVLVRT